MQNLGQRDLAFRPVENARPRKLSRRQIDHYNHDGYVTPLDCFTADQMVEHRGYFEDRLAQLNALNDGRDQYALNGYQARCQGIWDLATHPNVLDLVEDIVGPDIICWATHYFCKLPHDEKVVPWHQDASYWGLTPARTVTVWLAIDDADDQNAAMKFIPGSHKLGHLEWKEHQGPAALHQEIVGAGGLAKPMYNVLKAGQVSLHADMLAHGSDANHSSRRRCGLTLRYFPPYVRRSCDYTIEPIVARGQDPSGYWQREHCPRPAGNDVTPRTLGK